MTVESRQHQSPDDKPTSSAKAASPLSEEHFVQDSDGLGLTCIKTGLQIF